MQVKEEVPGPLSMTVAAPRKVGVTQTIGLVSRS
jgi:hypothetical protein